MGINNEFVKPHMESLFGEQQLVSVQHACANKRPDEREMIVLQ